MVFVHRSANSNTINLPLQRVSYETSVLISIFVMCLYHITRLQVKMLIYGDVHFESDVVFSDENPIIRCNKTGCWRCCLDVLLFLIWSNPISNYSIVKQIMIVLNKNKGANKHILVNKWDVLLNVLNGFKVKV